MNGPTDTKLLGLYRGAAAALGPVLPLWTRRRARNGKEDAARLLERQGRTDAARPAGPLVWLHGASVGECTMLLPLIQMIRRRREDITILLTSGTVTAANLMKSRLPDGCIHQYVPLDSPKYARRFMQHWQPDMAIWAESEIWPNLIFEAKTHGAKLALINARMSQKSLSGWRKRPASAKAIFSKFDCILAADDVTAKGLSEFTAEEVLNFGTLKDAALPLPANKEDLAALRAAIGERPVWCAASTHEGEDDIIFRAHKEVLESRPETLLILAPRHPERRNSLTSLLSSQGLSYCMRSKNELPSADTQAYLFDTIGEMGLAFRCAPIAFMGGSLLSSLSGHNPLEPARLGGAVLSGPHTASFSGVYADMSTADAIDTAASAAEISRAVTQMLSSANRLRSRQDSAKAFSRSRSDILPRVWAEIAPFLPAGSTE